MAIFDAVAGGGGDSELDLFENLSERAKYAKVLCALDTLLYHC